MTGAEKIYGYSIGLMIFEAQFWIISCCWAHKSAAIPCFRLI